jgi:hypothetical protein
VNRTEIFSVALVVSASLLPTDASATDWTVSLRGAGPVRIGMSVTLVRRILGDAKARLSGNEPDVPLTECAYLLSKRIPEGLGFMFANGRVVRIDVYEGSTRTSAGARIGDSEDRIKRLYPSHLTTEPHRYVDDGHYLYYSPNITSGQKVRIVFETDGQTVTSFRVGTLEATALVEGCS